MNLFIKGSVDAATLERFADGCNYLARKMYTDDHTLQISSLDESNKPLFGGTLGSSFTGRYFSELGKMMKNPNSMTPLVGLIGLLIYPILCVLPTLLMIPGFVCKGIALKVNDQAKKYNEFAVAYFAYEVEKKPLRYIERELEFRKSDLRGKELQKDLVDGQVNQEMKVFNQDNPQISQQLQIREHNRIQAPLIPINREIEILNNTISELETQKGEKDTKLMASAAILNKAAQNYFGNDQFSINDLVSRRQITDSKWEKTKKPGYPELRFVLKEGNVELEIVQFSKNYSLHCKNGLQKGYDENIEGITTLGEAFYAAEHYLDSIS